MAEQTDTEMANSLGALANLVGGVGFPANGQTNQVSLPTSLYYNLRWFLVSNNRTLLSQLYAEHGIVQTLVDQPVEDAFRVGFEIKTGQLDQDEIEQLKIFWERDRVGHAVTQACKWARLFGGGAVLIITEQPSHQPLNWDKINENSKIEFRAVDLWELYNQNWHIEGQNETGEWVDPNPDFFTYYGVKVHPTRVFAIKGKEPPSIIRGQLRGWGMSELERLIRSLNQYMKNQDVVFALLDEAKIDVYKMKGFNSSLLTMTGTTAISSRIQNANLIKNYNNAITMDVGDEYEQKTMAFTGLAEMLVQIRQGVAADLKMPVTKLFGISAAGFSSGEDDIENYNAMIESEVRAKTKFIVVDMLGLCCQKLFGFRPDDLMIEFSSLRVMDGVEEEEIKTQKFNRVQAAYDAGLATAQEYKISINKASLLPHELDETTDAMPPVGQDLTAPTSAKKVDDKA